MEVKEEVGISFQNKSAANVFIKRDVLEVT